MSEIEWNNEGAIGYGLVELTRILHANGYTWDGGLLGGEFGYGAHFENDTFQMHPYCWCERDDCAWCCVCSCEGVMRGSQWITTVECDNCKRDPAPNFLHKPSGTWVRWYKWIGRGMEFDVVGDWKVIADECAASITPNLAEDGEPGGA